MLSESDLALVNVMTNSTDDGTLKQLQAFANSLNGVPGAGRLKFKVIINKYTNQNISK